MSDDILLGLYRERERYIAVAFRYLQDREKARDVFSDSYAYVLEHRHTLTGDLTKMKIYLMQTVKHKCLDAMRHDDAARKACANLYENSIRMLPGDNITQNVIRQDIYTLIRDTGNKISRRTLDIYVSRKFHGLSHKELAGRIGRTVRHHPQPGGKGNLKGRQSHRRNHPPVFSFRVRAIGSFLNIPNSFQVRRTFRK